MESTRSLTKSSPDSATRSLAVYPGVPDPLEPYYSIIAPGGKKARAAYSPTSRADWPAERLRVLFSRLRSNGRICNAMQAAIDDERSFDDRFPEVDYYLPRVMVIYPNEAAILLSRNDGNRRTRVDSVKRWAAQMQSGEFKIASSTVAISEQSLTRDSTHRLLACLRANTPFMTNVLFGVDYDHYKTADQGNSRTKDDEVTVQGISLGKQLVATLGVLHAHSTGKFTKIGKMRHDDLPVLELLEKHPRIEGSVAWSVENLRRGNKSLLSPSLSAYLHYLLSETYGKEIEAFLIALDRGVNLSEGSTVHWLREKLTDAKKRGSVRISAATQLAYAIDCWLKRHDAKFEIKPWSPSSQKSARQKKFPVLI